MKGISKILFVCTFRGGRSQVADFYTRKHGKDLLESEVACFDPGTIGQGFIDTVAKLGMDLSKISPESPFSSQKRLAGFDYVVCLCSESGTELCNLFRDNIDKLYPNATRLHWEIPDFGICSDAPEGFETCVFSICQMIERKVLELVAKIRSHSLTE